MKEIKLTKGQVALVDDEDYEYVMQFKWTAVFQYGIYYARTNIYKEDGKRTTMLLHRLIMKPSNSKIFVDHINHNGLDNRSCNLRLVSNTQNVRNRRGYGASKYLGVGVHIDKRSGRKCYVAYIQTKYLASFPFTPEGEIAAAKAYDKKAIELYGEFANPNFKKGPDEMPSP